MSFLDDVKVGDYVAIDSAGILRRYRRVERLTKDRVVLEGNDHYYRGNSSNPLVRGHYPGKPVGGGGYYIKRIATPDEILKWEEEKKRLARVESSRRAIIDARNARRNVLSTLFSGFNVWVRDNENLSLGRYDVIFHDLTEAEIRLLAERLSK